MTEYNWVSPGGLYVVPVEFRERFLAEFPEYRIRWSLQKQCWMIEQQCGRGALPPVHIGPFDDDLIRARDGYWQVMWFQPGDRMACPFMTNYQDGQRCGLTLKVPTRQAAEVRCESCIRNGRDGRTMASYWPFDECLLEHLRWSDPLRGGIQRARASADDANHQRMALLEKQRSNAVTSMDQVDYRWLTGMASSSGKRRQLDSNTFK